MSVSFFNRIERKDDEKRTMHEKISGMEQKSFQSGAVVTVSVASVVVVATA